MIASIKYTTSIHLNNVYLCSCMKCLSCQNTIAKDSNFCSRCGQHFGIKSQLKGKYKKLEYATRKKSKNVQEKFRSSVVNSLDPYLKKIQKQSQLEIGKMRLSKEKSDKIKLHLLNLKNKIDPSDFKTELEYEQWKDKVQNSLGVNSCIICYSSWELESEIIVCPGCYHGGHREHLENWVQAEKKCPLCLKEVLKKSLVVVKIQET